MFNEIIMFDSDFDEPEECCPICGCITDMLSVCDRCEDQVEFDEY